MREKRNLVGQTRIRQLQIGAIYMDNEEGRRKKRIFEVRKELISFNIYKIDENEMAKNRELIHGCNTFPGLGYVKIVKPQ